MRRICLVTAKVTEVVSWAVQVLYVASVEQILRERSARLNGMTFLVCKGWQDESDLSHGDFFYFFTRSSCELRPQLTDPSIRPFLARR